MAQISYINTSEKKNKDLKFNIPTDESVGAMLFDLSGFKQPFSAFPTLYHNFKDNAIQAIKTIDEAVALGIEDNGFLNGMVFYHVSQYFKYLGHGNTLYIAFADCTKDWNVLCKMQQDANGHLFHIGVWTAQSIWRMKDDGSIGFTQLITDLQLQANEINGKIGNRTVSMTPLNIILFGNSNYIDGNPIDYRMIPDAIELGCHKVSVVLAQNGSEQVHKIQEKNPNKAPVSSLGLVMACLSLCGAEESISSVKKCDLNKGEEFNFPELGFGSGFTPYKNIHRIMLNSISSRGYIVPISYEGIEASYFLSSDQTLGAGDFSTIANNRVMHKCRRAMSTALIPYVNSHHIYTPGTHTISSTSIAIITSSVNAILDSVMKNKQGFSQIEGRTLVFLENKDILNDDSVSVELKIKPANYSSFISEQVSHNVL